MRRTRTYAFTKARREAVAEAMKRDDYRCQAQRVWPHTCMGPLVGHEPRKRSQGGDPTNPDHILVVCQSINDRVEREPNWARDHGLSVHGWHQWSWSEHWEAS